MANPDSPDLEYPRFEVQIKGNPNWLKFYDAAVKLDMPDVALGYRVLDEDWSTRTMTREEADHMIIVAIELGNAATGAMPQ